MQSRPQPQTESKASLGYLRLSMEKKPNNQPSPWSAEKRDRCGPCTQQTGRFCLEGCWGPAPRLSTLGISVENKQYM